jgi:cobalt-zinc-cadmium efflux system outer membrane protein
MIYQKRAVRLRACTTVLSVLLVSNCFGQRLNEPVIATVVKEASTSSVTNPVVALYFDPLQGTSSRDLIQRALGSNGELAAARLEVERARARLRQAALRKNPSVDIEHATGAFTGSPGERETSIGLSIPLELGGLRQRRIDLAKASLEATEAEIQNRERQLASEVYAIYAEAMAALRELQITENLNDIDTQTTRFVQARVNEGESAPIELNLLRVEVDRLRSRRALSEGKLKASLLKLKLVAGLFSDEPLRLREELESPQLQSPPASVSAAIELALRSRPDLRLARLNEELAQAGLRLAQAEARPEVIPFTKYTVGRSIIEDTPVGSLIDHDKTISFGVSIALPIFNRNQGDKAEAALAISQAEKRRQFLEQIVRSEVSSAYERYEAARNAVQVYQQGVIARSNENIRAIRAAYEIGEFRISDLLTEQRRLAESQQEFTQALAEKYRALADIHTALGLPPIQ